MSGDNTRLPLLLQVRQEGMERVSNALNQLDGSMASVHTTAKRMQGALKDLRAIDKLEKSYQMVRKEMGQVAKASNEVSKSIEKVDKSSKGAEFSLKGFVGSFTMVTTALRNSIALLQDFAGLVQGAFEFASAGAESMAIAEGFERMGGTAADMERLRAATAGVVDDTTLQGLHRMGVEFRLTRDEMRQVLEATTSLAIETGKLGNIENELIQGIKGFSKAEEESWTRLGLTLGAVTDRAEKLHGPMKDLTSESQIFAKQAAALELLAEKGLSPAFDSASLSFAQAKAEMANFVSDLQGMAAQAVINSGVLDDLSGLLDILRGFFVKNADTIKGALVASLNVLSDRVGGTQGSLDLLLSVFEAMPGAVKMVVGSFDVLIGATRLVFDSIAAVVGLIGTGLATAFEGFSYAASKIAGLIGMDGLSGMLGELSSSMGVLRKAAMDTADFGIDGLGKASAQLVQGFDNFVSGAADVSMAFDDITRSAMRTTDAYRDLNRTLSQLSVAGTAFDELVNFDFYIHSLKEFGEKVTEEQLAFTFDLELMALAQDRTTRQVLDGMLDYARKAGVLLEEEITRPILKKPSKPKKKKGELEEWIKDSLRVADRVLGIEALVTGRTLGVSIGDGIVQGIHLYLGQRNPSTLWDQWLDILHGPTVQAGLDLGESFVSGIIEGLGEIQRRRDELLSALDLTSESFATLNAEVDSMLSHFTGEGANAAAESILYMSQTMGLAAESITRDMGAIIEAGEDMGKATVAAGSLMVNAVGNVTRGLVKDMKVQAAIESAMAFAKAALAVAEAIFTQQYQLLGAAASYVVAGVSFAAIAGGAGGKQAGKGGGGASRGERPKRAPRENFSGASGNGPNGTVTYNQVIINTVMHSDEATDKIAGILNGSAQKGRRSAIDGRMIGRPTPQGI